MLETTLSENLLVINEGQDKLMLTSKNTTQKCNRYEETILPFCNNKQMLAGGNKNILLSERTV